MPCPRYQQMFNENFKTDTYKSWRLKYKWLYDYLETHSGKSLQKAVDVFEFHDALKILQLRNRT